MTPKIIELQQAPVVLVELPEGTTGIKLEFVHNKTWPEMKPIVYMHFDIAYGMKKDKIRVPYGSSIIGILSDLTEEQFAECVDLPKPMRIMTAKLGPFFKDYIKDDFQIMSAKYSFDTLLESEDVYTENPYSIPTRENLRGKPAEAHSEIREHMRRWTEAQSRTIDPKRTVVLIKRV